jgi:hypothetical protein
MTPYASAAEFDFVAGNNFTISGPVTFGGFSSQSSIFFSLIAGNQLLLSPGATVTANIGNFELSAGGMLTGNGSSVQNNIGNIRLTSGSDMLLQEGTSVSAFGNVGISCAGDFTLSHSSISGDSIIMTPVGGALSVDFSSLSFGHFGVLAATHDITINNSVINTSPVYGLISLTSSAGSVNVTGTAMQTHFLTINSGDGILLDGSGGSLPITGNGSTGNFTAVNIAQVKNCDFTGFSLLNITAHTINLFNDAFSGTVNLKSDNGLWHNGYALGSINDLGGNNTYNGKLLIFADGTTGTLTGTGITISKR